MHPLHPRHQLVEIGRQGQAHEGIPTDVGVDIPLDRHLNYVQIGELAADAFSKEGNDLKNIRGWVADSGEGQWTVDAAMEEAVPANVLTAALFARYRSRTDDSFADKLLSAMRFGFGGHVEMPQ